MIISITGCSSSGKTTLAKSLYNRLKDTNNVALISMDSFYRNLNQYEKELASQGLFNFDHPDAIDMILFKETMNKLMRCEMVDIPIYDFITSERTSNYITYDEPDIVIVEGLFIDFKCDVNIFIDIDADVALSRRIIRDVQERGRTIDSVLNYYNRFVSTGFKQFVEPNKKICDLILCNVTDVVIDMICSYVNPQYLQTKN